MGAKGKLMEDDLAYFTEVDHADREALGARENGIERFQARLFAFNHGMLALFEDIGEPASGLGAALRAAAKGLVGLRPLT